MKYFLIIDDSPTIRTSIKYTVKDLGFSIEDAENGVEALKKVKSIKDKGDDFAMIIVDVNMPEMDGITFVSEYRKIDKFTPIVFLTTESEDDKIKKGKEAGASGWIIKPFKPNDLLNVINKLVK